VLCPSCRCQVAKGAPYCGACGAAVAAGAPPLELGLPDGDRLVLAETVTIGRAPANSIQLPQQSVSRTHARIVVDGRGAVIEDTGSSHGTWVDGQRIEAPTPLHAGALVHLGDVALRVEAADDEAAAGRTIVVPAGASVIVPAAGPAAVAAPAVEPRVRPRVASGWALKRLDASEGEKRFVLRDLNGGDFVRLSADDAELFELIDGTRTLPELIGESERAVGPAGPARLARLLADLSERGLLSGVEGGDRTAAPRGRLARLFRPREFAWRSAGGWFTRLYHRGGWVLFTRPALAFVALVAVAGIGVFAYLVAGRYGTPFVVARKIGIGALVFLAGRFAFVALHEGAHGLTMASLGRRVEKAGVKLVLIFPYAFVDTSQAWFEPRRRRIAVSAAGPLSDLFLGAAFAIACLLVPHGTLRDIFFTLAFAAYVGAFFNLNPFIDRDGYQIMVDAMGEPGLRRRSKEQLQRLLSGGPRRESDTVALTRYGIAAMVWSLVAVLFVVALSTRYYKILNELAPRGLVWAALTSLYLMLFIPVVWSLARPLWQRGERLPTEIKRVRI
jgi:putative peptide zinc metalloprotease protein